MIVLKRTAKGYKNDPTKHFKFQRFENVCGDFYLVEAAFEEHDKWDQFNLTYDEIQNIKKKKIYRLEFEEPNKFFLGDDFSSYDFEFHKIFTLCPYTSEWSNNKENNNRRVPIYFPFNENDIPGEEQKLYDIIYTGHIVSKKIYDYIKVIAKFNYRFVSNQKNSLVTNLGASYHDKLNLIARSKITLVSNLLYPKLKHFKNIWSYEDWYQNDAFKKVPRPSQLWKIFTDKNIVVPQLKSRVFEAAFCKSLILCKKDDFNVIERYFEPNKEFVYFEDNLQKKIFEILQNFSDYQDIIDNAYRRATECYTTESFVNDFLPKI